MRRTFLLVPAFLLVLVSLPDPALADDVRCGRVLTRDTVLRRDLVDCPGDGLVIGADKITLDLGGHAISGRGADGSAGIRNAGHDRVTIRNGGISRFGRGVLLTGGANRNRLRRLNVQNNNEDGIALVRSHHNRVEANATDINGRNGILLSQSDDNVVTANLVSKLGSDGNAANGIAVARSNDNRVTGNRVFQSNGVAGIFVGAASSGTLVAGNLARANTGGDGIRVENRRTTIRDNTAIDNERLGIFAVRGVTDGGGNRASGNIDPRQCVNVPCRAARAEPPPPPGPPPVPVPQFPVQPVYVFPHDLPFHPEYVRAISDLVAEVKSFYLTQTGKAPLFEELRVVRAADDYLTMRCGPAPTPGCRDNRQELPNWGHAVEVAVGGYPTRQATWVFSEGGGGFAAGSEHSDFVGFAITGDFTLEPISGVPEPAGIPCTFATFQCEGTVPKGAAVHELGHAFQLHHPGPFTPGRSFMAFQGNYPSGGLLPHEKVIIENSPFFGADAFDPQAPFLALENADVVREGSTVELTGRDFAPGDAVEFTVPGRTVRVAPEVKDPGHLSLRVPEGLFPGAVVRVRRGALRSNPLTVNVEPLQIPKFPVIPSYVVPADQVVHPEYVRAINSLITETKAFFKTQTGKDLDVEPLQIVHSTDDYLSMRCGPDPAPACRDNPEALPEWFSGIVRAIGGSFLANQANWVFAQGGGGFAQGGVIGTYAGFAITGDFTLEPISGLREPAGISCTPTTRECQGNLPKGQAVHQLAHALGLLEPGPATPGPTVTRDPGSYPKAGLLAHEKLVLRASPFFDSNAFDQDTPFLGGIPPLSPGTTVELTGRDFAAGDVVEFTDIRRTVRVAAQFVDAEHLRVPVPAGVQPGFARVRRGALRGNPQAFNVQAP